MSGALAVLHLHIHLQPRGPKFDYVGVFVAALLSWAGLPGPGEAALVAAAIAAAHHHLDLASVIAVAFAGATVGGMAGWVVGRSAGRTVVTAPGPLHRHRMAAVARGDRFYERYGVIAVLFTPSWIAGIHGMRLRRYTPINALSALVWALGIGLGAYAAGPSITDIASDIGSAVWLILAVLVASAVIALLLRRRGRGNTPGGATRPGP